MKRYWPEWPKDLNFDLSSPFHLLCSKTGVYPIPLDGTAVYVQLPFNDVVTTYRARFAYGTLTLYIKENVCTWEERHRAAVELEIDATEREFLQAKSDVEYYMEQCKERAMSTDLCSNENPEWEIIGMQLCVHLRHLKHLKRRRARYNPPCSPVLTRAHPAPTVDCIA